MTGEKNKAEIPTKTSPQRKGDFKKLPDIDRLSAMKEGAQDKGNAEQKEGQAKAKRVFEPHSFKKLLQLPPKKWIIEKIIGFNDIGVIYGASGTGKTFVIIDLIVSLCRRILFANFFNITEKPLRVAYFAGEGLSGLPERFKAAAKHHGIDDLPNFTFYKIPPQLFLEESSEAMINFLIEHKDHEGESFDIIFIDTLHSATVGAKENDGTDTGKILATCKMAMEKLKCSIVLVHHTNKNGEEERGHSALRAACDFMVKIGVNFDKQAYIKCAKLKDGESWNPIGFDLCKTDGCKSAHVEWGEPFEIKSDKPSSQEKNKQKLIECMELHEGGHRFEVKDLVEATGKDGRQVRRILKSLVEEGKCKVILKDHERPASNTNPNVYYIEPY